MTEPVLRIEDLHVTFTTETGTVEAVRGVALTVDPGSVVGLVGESGSGKSVTALSALRLLQSQGVAVTTRAARLDVAGRPVLSMAAHELRQLRGSDVGMIFQDPTSSLNPLLSIGEQIEEAMRVHGAALGPALAGRVRALLTEVGLDELHARLGAFPHQLSGGQKQRVMIAIALANDPRLLIADEPTTALDATVQLTLLRLLRRLANDRNMGVLLVTHDLDVVARIADEVVVMRDGRVVEAGTRNAVLGAPRDPYTQALVASRTSPPVVPRAHVTDAPLLLDVEHLSVRLPVSGRFGATVEWTTVLDDVSFQVRNGTTLGIVGESGSGKTTLARALLRLVDTAGGRVNFNGTEVLTLGAAPLRQLRRQMQMVFQDANGALDPRCTVLEALTEPLDVHGLAGDARGRRRRAASLLEEVGLGDDLLARRPHQLSGGQRQRVGIARALAVEPTLLVCDESVSSLDATVQAAVIALLRRLQSSRGLSYIFISHDLRLVAQLADTLVVMHGGRIVESGPCADVFANPRAAATLRLIEAGFGAGSLRSIESGLPLH